MKIVFFGTPKEVIPVLDTLQKHFDVAAVVTTPDQKSGRKHLLNQTPVKIFSQIKKLPVLTPLQFNDEVLKQLNIYNPELFVVAAYGKLIPETILKLPKFGAINIHPSLLPNYRGPTPIQTAILNGDSKTGITIMKMDDKMDHGPILHQIPYTIDDTDTFEWLMEHMFSQAGVILPHIIDEYTIGKMKLTPQDDKIATYTKIISKQNGYIDISVLDNLNSSQLNKWKIELDRKIRAYYPWPTVWTILNTSVSSDKEDKKLVKFLPNNRIQVEGKKTVNIKDFLNGYPLMRKTIEKVFDFTNFKAK